MNFKLNDVFLGDILEYLSKIEDNYIDLILIDPPFGVEFDNNRFFDDSKETVFNLINNWIQEMHRVLKDRCHIYIFVPTLEIDKWVFAVKKYFVFKNLLALPAYTNHRYLKDNFSFNLQLIIYASKGKAKKLNKIDWIRTSNGWFKDKRNKNPNLFTYQYPSFINNHKTNTKANAYKKLLHPNQKNEELCKNLIKLSTNKGDLVADFFCGSGTILYSAKTSNRNYIGCDNNPDAIKITKERLKQINRTKSGVLGWL